MIHPQSKPRRIRSARYLKFVREQGCVLSPDTVGFLNVVCGKPIDAHHVKPLGGGIMGGKVSDMRCVGLCRLHHQMAERYPVSHRGVLEAEIKRLNRTYNALHQPSVKSERKPSMKVWIAANPCTSCGQNHKVPWRKAGVTAQSFMCPKTGKEVRIS